MADTQPELLANDLIYGAVAIGAEINRTPKQVYKLVENKRIPVGHLGNSIVASRGELRAHFERLTRAGGK
jgi:hypothetical protein